MQSPMFQFSGSAVPKSNKNMKVSTWNIQTFNGKEKAIEQFLVNNNIEILAATETSHTDTERVSNSF
jgi:hypothetical protein